MAEKTVILEINVLGVLYRPENDQVYFVCERKDQPGWYFFMTYPSLTEPYRSEAQATGRSIQELVDDVNIQIWGSLDNRPAYVSKEALERSIATYDMDNDQPTLKLFSQ